MKQPSPTGRPPLPGPEAGRRPNRVTNPLEPVFDLQSVRPRRPASSAWITVTDDDLIDDDGAELPQPQPSRARRVVVRMVGYLLIVALFAGTARLVAQRNIRDAILDWTTFGFTDYARSAQKRIADFVRRWLSH